MKHVFRLLVLLGCLIVGKAAVAASVAVDWTASTSTNIAGYHVYFGTTSGNYTNKADAGNTTSITISNLIPGVTYYFAATAYDASGNESGFSTEASFIVPGVLTMAPAATPGAAPVIQFPVVPGSWYEVQATTDFKNWTTVGQTAVMQSNIWMQFTDPYASQFSSRYYRLVQH